MRVKGQETIAGMFGVAPKTIVEWQEQGLPIAERGGPGVPNQYDSAACIRWLVDRELRKVQAESPNDRLARVKADAIEMDNAERRGRLIPADQLEPRLRAAFVAAREAWVNEPPQLARKAVGKSAQEIEDMLAAAFEAFLLRLVRWQHADVIDDEDAERAADGDEAED